MTKDHIPVCMLEYGLSVFSVMFQLGHGIDVCFFG